MCTNNINYVTEIMETYFEIYTKQVSCPFGFPLLDISICLSVLKYLSLYIYMTTLSPNLISRIMLLLSW